MPLMVFGGIGVRLMGFEQMFYNLCVCRYPVYENMLRVSG